jgi:hypothetical protein
MTMEEFLAQRAITRANVEMFGEKKSTRQTETDLSGLQRRENEELGTYGNFLKEKAAEAARKAQRSTGKNQLLDVGFKNASLESQGREEESGGRGGRGGRGEGGRGGRGEGRGGRGERRPRPTGENLPRAGGAAGKILDVSDALSFPSL